MATRRRLQRYLGEANCHVRLTRWATTPAWHLQDLDAGNRFVLQRLPQARLFVLQLPIVFGADEEFGTIDIGRCLAKQLVHVGFAISHAHQKGFRLRRAAREFSQDLRGTLRQ